MEQAALRKELQLLGRILREELFRFVLAEYNHASAIEQAEAFIRDAYPSRSVLALPIKGNQFRSFSEQIKHFQRGIVLIPDFDELFTPEQDDFRIAFNQRRDWLAEQPIALICFMPTGGLQAVMRGMPDFWSRRDAELNLQVPLPDRSSLVMQEAHISTIGGLDAAGKSAELQRLRLEVAATDPNNFSQLDNLYRQLLPLLEDLGDYRAGLEAAREYQRLAALEYEHHKDASSLGYGYDRMATFYRYLGQYADAENYARKALELAEESGDLYFLAAAQNNFAEILKILGDYEGSKSILEKAMEALKQQIGATYPDITTINSNLASVLHASGDYQKAKLASEIALKSTLDLYGSNHPNTAARYSNLALILKDLGDYQEAKSLLEKAMKIDEGYFGANHPNTATIYWNLATVLMDLKEYDKARPLLESAQQVFLTQLGDKHPYTEKVKTWLAKLDQLEGKTD